VDKEANKQRVERSLSSGNSRVERSLSSGNSRVERSLSSGNSRVAWQGINQADVLTLFRECNTRKSPGPDKISEHV
jgi:hypothetical protein